MLFSPCVYVAYTSGVRFVYVLVGPSGPPGTRRLQFAKHINVDIVVSDILRLRQ